MRHRSGIVASALLVALALTACGDRIEAPPHAPVAPGDSPRVGTVSPTTAPATSPSPSRTGPRTREEAQAVIDEGLRQVDEHARRLLERFRGLVYDPMRDNGLRTASGTAELEVDGRKGSFRFTFDASKKDAEQVAVEKVSADEGLHEGAERQVVRFVYLATRGAYSSVLSIAPPVTYLVTRGADGAEILSVPPTDSSPGVSHRFDAKGLVALSGVAEEKTPVRTSWQWIDRAGRHLLIRAKEDGGKAVTSYDYADERGMTLLREASIVEAAHRCAAKLTWAEVVTK